MKPKSVPQAGQTPVNGSISAAESFCFNQLHLKVPDQLITAAFSPRQEEGWHEFRREEFPPELLRQLPWRQLPGKLYVRFRDFGNLPTITCRPAEWPDLARTFYTWRIRELVSAHTGYYRQHYLYDTQFWCVDRNKESDERYDTLERFTLKICGGRNLQNWRLQVSYNGPAYLLRQNLKDLEQLQPDTRKFGEVLFRNEVSPWRKQSEAAGYYPEEVFPVLNPAVAEWLGIPFPADSIDEICIQAFPMIKAFMQQYRIKNILQETGLSCGKFRKVHQSSTGLLSNASQQLQFGEGNLCGNPLEGLMKYGPAERPAGFDFCYFIIYFRKNRKEAEALDRCLTGADSLPSIRQLTRLPLVHAREYDIELPSEKAAKKVVNRWIRFNGLHPKTKWLALYITPGSATDSTPLQKDLFYYFKEKMQLCYVPLQGIRPDTLNNLKCESLLSLSCAIIQKLKGVPWYLNCNHKQELVIGLATNSNDMLQKQYTGSIACLSAAGMYNGLSYYSPYEKCCVPSWITKRLKEWQQKNGKARQLVIHTNIPQGGEEQKQLQDNFREHDLTVPVVTIYVRMAGTGDMLAFGSRGDHVQPCDGTWVRTGRNTCLLYAGGTVGSDDKVYRPLHLTITCSDPLWEKHINVPELLEDFYAYTRLSCNPCTHAPIPATVHFSKRLVNIVPYFVSKLMRKGCLERPVTV